MNLYKRIDSLCRDRRISVTDMCKESGASRGSLGDLKSGKKKTLSVETLSKIAKYFGITIDELVSSGNQRLYEARLMREKSNTEMAQLLGIDIATYNHYEDTCNAPEHILAKASDVLDVDFEFIAGDEYVLDFPISAWSREDKDDYECATDVRKIGMEYKIGKIRYISPNIASSSPFAPEFYNLVDQLTLKELREIQAIMEEKIKNRR